MDKKLTLSLNAAIIEEAKVYAKEQGVSLSRLVETYLRKVLLKRENEQEWSIATQELMNAAEPAGDYDEKKVILEYLTEKYK